MSGSLVVVVWGPPKPQGRPRAARWRAKDGREGVTLRTPAGDRTWRGLARSAMLDALAAQELEPPFVGAGVPVRLTVLAIFPCPVSDHRKRSPVPRRWHTKRGDLDNVIKAVKDAGNGVLWSDDSQVSEVCAAKLIAAQGESPRVWLRVEADPVQLQGVYDDTGERR